ncbi:MAG: CvpA family protein [Oscillospiraceae bacterium]|nr:CvpA family protein [Oscillospiraceae bacterium]MDD3261948.1 CvpA family protein [Oscillospiraceae bacterium]
MAGTIVDIILLVIFIVCIVKGAGKGAVLTVAGLVGLIVAVIFSPRFGKWISSILPAGTAKDKSMRDILCTILAFVLIMVAAGLLCRLLDRVCRLPGLHALNHILGGVLGAVKGVLLVMLVCALLRLSLPLLAEQFPDKVQLSSFSSSAMLQLKQNSSASASSQSSGWGAQAQKSIQGFINKLPEKVRNPVYSFYEKILREDVQANAK